MAQQLAEGASALTPTPPGSLLNRPAPSAHSTKVTLRKFRPDIEGLRAIAIITVVLGHAALGLPGGYVGVDVFFVISGFLITRQLVDEHEKHGRISFAGFYARRARRILPAATLVTIATLIAAYLFVSPLRFTSTVHDGIAAALFGVNWHLAAQATNYFHASAPPSPFQHYWSLSVEEQFYLIWPLLLTLIALLVRRRLGHRKPLIAVLAIAIAASLWTSIHVTSVSAPYAYFGTHTRVWELALGALIAVCATELHRIPRPAAAVIGWTGVAAIAAACATYSDATPYPGYAALLPVLGAGAIIAAGCGEAPRFGPETLLKQKPMQLGGLLSYSLYLWHWPLLVLLPQALGHPLSLTQRLLAVVAAVALSAITYLAVESPLRHATIFVVRRQFAAGFAAGLIGASVVTALITQSVLTIPDSTATTPTSALAASASKLHHVQISKHGDVTTAVATAADMTTLPVAVQPPLDQAAADFPDTKGCEVTDLATAPKLPCSQFGDPRSHRRVVLIGDSHAGMWVDGLNEVAKSKHWRLTVFTKNGCSVGAYPGLIDTTRNRLYAECTAWRHAVLRRIAAIRPDLVVIGSEGRSIAADHASGLTQSIKQVRRSGARVAFLADTPSPRSVGPIPDCLAQHPDDVQTCAIPRSDADQSGGGRTAEIDAARAAGAKVIDPTPWFCTTDRCPPVIQDVVVYADASHITGSYGLLRAPQLSVALSPLMR